jgi:hypothetical protein
MDGNETSSDTQAPIPAAPLFPTIHNSLRVGVVLTFSAGSPSFPRREWLMTTSVVSASGGTEAGARILVASMVIKGVNLSIDTGSEVIDGESMSANASSARCWRNGLGDHTGVGG